MALSITYNGVRITYQIQTSKMYRAEGEGLRAETKNKISITDYRILTTDNRRVASNEKCEMINN